MMKLEIDFPESIAADIRRQALERGMEPEYWVLQFVMRKLSENESRAGDAKFQAAAQRVFEDFDPAFEALARSEREDAAMAPEELALKYPNRR